MASTGPRYAALRASPGTVSPGGATAGTYYCRYCQLSCTGPAPYKQHLDSAKHMKKASLYGGLQRQGAEDTGNCVASPDPHRARPSSRVDDVLAWTPSPVPSQTAVPSGGATGDPYYCQHCRLGCSGPEPFKQHLESARHIKKATLAGSPARQRGEDNRQQALPDPYRNCSSPSTDDLLHPVVTSDSAGTFFSSSGAPGGLYHCQYCQLSCTGPEPFKQHLESARHIKKAAQAGSPARQQDEDSRDSRTLWDLCRSRWSPSTDDPLHPVVTSDSAGTFSSSRGATGDPYHCQHCQLSCTGPEPFKQHLESARHIKKAAQTGSPARQQDEDSRDSWISSDPYRFSWSPSTDDPLQPVVTSDSAGTFSSFSGAPSGLYYCQHCQLGCSGPEPFKQHLESARHIKKAALAGSPARQQDEDSRDHWISPDPYRSSWSPSTDDPLQPVVTSDSAGTFSSSRGATGDPYHCQHCQLSCTGPEPFKQHLESARHIKKAAQTGSPVRQQDEDSRYDPASSDAHRARWSPSTDDPLHSVLTSDSAGTFSSSSGAPGGVYYCQYCQLSCTGPEPFKQHLESARHIKKAAQTGSPARIVRVPLGASSPRPEPGQPGQEPADPVWTELPQLQPDMMATCRTALLGSTAACRAVRRGSWLYDVVDRQDGVSEQVAIMVSQELKHLQPEGLTAFLQDTPLIRAEEPFSKRRC